MHPFVNHSVELVAGEVDAIEAAREFPLLITAQPHVAADRLFCPTCSVHKSRIMHKNEPPGFNGLTLCIMIAQSLAVKREATFSTSSTTLTSARRRTTPVLCSSDKPPRCWGHHSEQAVIQAASIRSTRSAARARRNWR